MHSAYLSIDVHRRSPTSKLKGTWIILVMINCWDTVTSKACSMALFESCNIGCLSRIPAARSSGWTWRCCARCGWCWGRSWTAGATKTVWPPTATRATIASAPVPTAAAERRRAPFFSWCLGPAPEPCAAYLSQWNQAGRACRVAGGRHGRSYIRNWWGSGLTSVLRFPM